MNPNLKALINKVNDGASDALTLKPDTLEAILKELERMCNSSDTIACEPIANGQPGFKIYARKNEDNALTVITGVSLVAGFLRFSTRKIYVIASEAAANIDIATSPSQVTAC